MLPFKEKTAAAWPRTRLQPSIVAAELPCTKGVLGHEGPAGCWRAISTDNQILAPKLRLSDPRMRGDASRSWGGEVEGDGSTRDRCKGL